MSGIAHLQQENIRLQRNLDNALHQLQEVQHERDSFCALAQSWETTATRYREERIELQRENGSLKLKLSQQLDRNEQLRAANEEQMRVLSGEDEQG